jgi:DNA-binding transcriptional ArsR family regulator
MSADTATQSEITRATKALLKGAGARLAGRSRGPDRRVRRNSFDVDDRRAAVWRAINGGGKQAGLRWRDTMLKVAREYDQVGQKKGRGAPLGPYTRDVLAALLELVDFPTGRLEPTYQKLMAMTGLAKSTISSALRRLRAHGFLDWVRRSRLVEKDDGVAREQTSNAYFFDVGRLAKAVRLRFQSLLDRRERTAAAAGKAAPPPRPAPPGPLSPSDSELAAALARLEALVRDGAE